MSQQILWQGESELAVETPDGVRRFNYVRRGSELLLTDGYGYWKVPVAAASSRRGHSATQDSGTDAAATGKQLDGRLTSQMPGKVLDVRVSQGDTVSAGQTLLVLEAMKMEHAITAPFDGTVARLTLTAGERVMPGDLLAEIEPLP